MALEIYNSLNKKEEVFKPISEGSVGIYTCGPTVYSFVTIGNWRTYLLGDLVVRTLNYLGYDTRYYMNITDVGHLTGDNLGDADIGEDRMEKAERTEGKDAWSIAQFYTDDFKKGYTALHLSPPEAFLRATDYIPEQIALVEKLIERGFGYTIDDGVYFDTQAYEKAGFTYGELSNLDSIRAGARVEVNPNKRDPRDFALWKFSPKGIKRAMEWDSPWGVGFPGWHIECSAMGMHCLGDQFDIHIGGEDLKSTHHPNEIAQSQGATGKSPFVHYWIHGAFLQVDGGRMGKSLGNAYTLQDIQAKGFSPLALRYFYLSAHYRSALNFTWAALLSSAHALTKMREHVQSLPTGGVVDTVYKERFIKIVSEDFNMPRAIALAWELLKDTALSPADIRATVLDMDTIFGLDLANTPKIEIPQAVQDLIKERTRSREASDWTQSDALREKIEALGYTIKDTDEGPVVSPK